MVEMFVFIGYLPNKIESCSSPELADDEARCPCGSLSLVWQLWAHRDRLALPYWNLCISHDYSVMRQEPKFPYVMSTCLIIKKIVPILQQQGK